MRKLEVTEKYRADSEEEAKDFLEEERIDAASKGYTLKKSGYEYKVKKAKGEVVDEAYVVTTVKVYNEVWDYWKSMLDVKNQMLVMQKLKFQQILPNYWSLF